ncbi:MAG: electron transport complex subunit RsxB [Gammaproteobacteria bacterium]|nr:electron transport complex subunit RsxB [Gammaproteobacteria bacterium]
MIAAVLVVGSLTAIIGVALSLAAARLPADRDTLTRRIDALLPQTQCGQCGYAGCRPYAEAIANGDAAINQCAPGGDLTIRAVAELLGQTPRPLNPVYGEHRGPLVATIDEAACIGCLRCLEVCPVDAILGAPRHLHTVLNDLCTGCELCIAPCPVDCISLETRAGHA